MPMAKMCRVNNSVLYLFDIGLSETKCSQGYFNQRELMDAFLVEMTEHIIFNYISTKVTLFATFIITNEVLHIA